MSRNQPTLTNFFLVVFITGILVLDGLVAYWRILFPRTLIFYFSWILLCVFLSRWSRKRLNRRNAENK